MINSGIVEIIKKVELIKKGENVGSSEKATLLEKLGIRPFPYVLDRAGHELCYPFG